MLYIFKYMMIYSLCAFAIADYVFFENSSSNPYLIRRIEELNKVLTCHFDIFVSVYVGEFFTDPVPTPSYSYCLCAFCDLVCNVP